MCYVLCRVQPRCHHEQLINTFQHILTHQHKQHIIVPITTTTRPCSVFYPHSTADAALAALKRSLKPRCCCAVLVCCVETTPTLPPPPLAQVQPPPAPPLRRVFCTCFLSTLYLHTILITIIITCLRRDDKLSLGAQNATHVVKLSMFLNLILLFLLPCDNEEKNSGGLIGFNFLPEW